jgi:hypothetical protein
MEVWSAAAQQTPDIVRTTDPQKIIASLKANPDIVWMGEVMVDQGVDQSSKLLKYQVSEIVGTEMPPVDFAPLLAFHASEMEIYYTSDLKQKKEGFHKTLSKTVSEMTITFDRETFEQVVRAVVRPFSAKYVPAVRIRQLLYFDQESKQFHAIPLAIAPLQKKKGEDQLEPMYWMIPEMENGLLDLKNGSLPFAQRLYQDVILDSIAVIKEKKDIKTVLAELYSRIRAGEQELHISNDFDMDGFVPMTRIERNRLVIYTDTIITFDPENNFGEDITIVKNELNGEEIKILQLIQDWGIDKRNKKIKVSTLGFTFKEENVEVGGFDPKFIWISNPAFIQQSQNTIRTE